MSASEEDTLVGEFKELDSQIISRLTLVILGGDTAYIEDITCPRVDMNFFFEWSTRYLTSERSERVRYQVDHSKIKFISINGHVIFCLLYKHQRQRRRFQRRDLLCNHNDGDLFTCEDNMLSSRVKI